MREKVQKLLEAGITASAIARGTGIDNSTISKCAKGERNFNRKHEEKFNAWLLNFKETIASI